jgi:hypothetical protein
MMDKEIPTPIWLSHNPELAALHILKTSLEVCRSALSVAYPDISEPPSPCPREHIAYVRAILHQTVALQAMLDEYAQSIERLHAWTNRDSGNQEIPF